MAIWREVAPRDILFYSDDSVERKSTVLQVTRESARGDVIGQEAGYYGTDTLES